MIFNILHESSPLTLSHMLPRLLPIGVSGYTDMQSGLEVPIMTKPRGHLITCLLQIEGSDLFSWTVGFLFLMIAILVLLFIAKRKTPVTIKEHWQNFLDGCQISTAEFYTAIRAGLADRQIPKVDLKEESFLERHVFSAKRVYLRVCQNEFVYYICAAPYGTGTFVSSWLCVKDGNVLNRIPVLSKLAGKDRGNKTFYQMDTEAMFRLAVQTTVLDVVNTMTEAKGLRSFAELEKSLNN